MQASIDRVASSSRQGVAGAETLLAAGSERLAQAREVDRYAHHHPWQVVGIGLALAACLIVGSRRA
jgi:ElaB/YqjD/DUF883 family membrane-anchored ribosome-binding protein